MEDNVVKLPGFDSNFLDTLRRSAQNTRPEVMEMAINQVAKIFNHSSLQEVRVKLPAGTSPAKIGRELAKHLNDCYREILTLLATELIQQEIKICRLEEGR